MTVLQRIPSFLTKSSQELTYPTDKLVVYRDGKQKVFEKGQLRDVVANESIYPGDLIIAFPEVSYYHLNQ